MVYNIDAIVKTTIYLLCLANIWLNKYYSSIFKKIWIPKSNWI